MSRGTRLRLGDDQQVVVAAQLLVVLRVALAPVVLLLQVVPLDAGAHRAVDVHYAALEQRLELLERVAPLQRVLPRLLARKFSYDGQRLCEVSMCGVVTSKIRVMQTIHPTKSLWSSPQQ